MKTKNLRAVVVSVALLISLTFAMDARSDTLKNSRMARVTFLDGTNRTVTVDGAGCTSAICSRVFVQGKSNDGSTAKIGIDGLAAIRDITPNSAVFVMKDGTQQRLSLISDFRVLYLDEGKARSQKLDLSKIQSLEMVGVTK